MLIGIHYKNSKIFYLFYTKSLRSDVHFIHTAHLKFNNRPRTARDQRPQWLRAMVWESSGLHQHTLSKVREKRKTVLHFFNSSHR